MRALEASEVTNESNREMVRSQYALWVLFVTCDGQMTTVRWDKINREGIKGSVSNTKGKVCWITHLNTCSSHKLHTVMRRITTFRSTTDRIYDSGPIRL